MGVFSRLMLMLTMAWLVGLVVSFAFMAGSPEPGWRDKFIAERNVRRAIAYRYVDIRGGSVGESGHDKGDNKASFEKPMDAESLGEGGATALPGAKVRNADSRIAIETRAGEAQSSNFGASRAEQEKAIAELRNEINEAQRQRRVQDNRLTQVRDAAALFAAEMLSYQFVVATFQQKVFNLDYEIQRVMIERDAIMAELARVNNDLRRLDGQQGQLEDQYWSVTRRYEEVIKQLSQYTNTDPNLARMADMAGKFLRGKVLAVGGDPRTGVVSISLGANEGVKENQVFSIYRGDKFVAKMRVENIRDNHATGRLLPEFMGKAVIAENDSVKTAEVFGGAAGN